MGEVIPVFSMKVDSVAPEECLNKESRLIYHRSPSSEVKTGMRLPLERRLNCSVCISNFIISSSTKKKIFPCLSSTMDETSFPNQMGAESLEALHQPLKAVICLPSYRFIPSLVPNHILPN